jgi:hypothetical protein
MRLVETALLVPAFSCLIQEIMLQLSLHNQPAFRDVPDKRGIVLAIGLDT